nr:metallophosphoesterase [Frigidibacter sp. ROC022]
MGTARQDHADPVARGQSLNRPDAVIYAVGDPHGRLDLFRRLERLILSDPDRPATQPALLVVLGDMLDRGPASAGLIEHLLAPPPRGLERICLMGNHEAMALAFFARPDPAAPWLKLGGAETLASYGIAPDPTLGYRLPARQLAARIDGHVPVPHLAFLRGLPLWLRIGPHFFSHAGPDPARRLDAQRPHELLWSRAFDAAPTKPPPDLGNGLAVQGHVPLPRAERRGWRLGVDTGACATGRLTAVRLQDGQAPAFLEAVET